MVAFGRVDPPRGVSRGRPIEGLFVALALWVALAALLLIGACAPSAARVDLTPVAPTPTWATSANSFGTIS